jgi:hypothetical protein
MIEREERKERQSNSVVKGHACFSRGQRAGAKGSYQEMKNKHNTIHGPRFRGQRHFINKTNKTNNTTGTIPHVP